MKTWFYYGLMGIFLSAFLICGTVLVRDSLEQEQFRSDMDIVAQYAVPVPISAAISSDSTPTSNQSTADTTEKVIPLTWIDYSALYNINNDFAAWLTIANTPVDFPVMQTKTEPYYYLNRDFNKNSNKYGLPFIAAECELDTPSDNILIHGHHMKDKSVFGTLPDYESAGYYKEHFVILLNTLDSMSEYEIFAVFKTPDSSEGFDYYNYIHLEDQEVFDEFIQKVKQLALYDTGIEPSYGSRLLTLSTCEYSQKNGRFVVVAWQKSTYSW